MANVLLDDEILDSTIWVTNSSPSFHGSASMVNFEDISRESNIDNNNNPSFLNQIDTKMENCNDDYDNCFPPPGKKRRLMPEQVQFLEKSFEVENKLEPDRKIQLAKQLGLQPRQVAIWFQNRRARYKTKILEREYDSLKASYEKLKADYDSLCKENESMKNEVNLLTEKLLTRENPKANPKKECDPITNPSNSQPKNPTLSPNVAHMLQCKQEDASSSVKSDVFDSDSPHYNHLSAPLEPLEPSANSSHVYEATEGSDFSQDENDDSLNGSLLMPPSIFPKIEDEYYDDLQPNSCNLGFPVQDQGTWFWQY